MLSVTDLWNAVDSVQAFFEECWKQFKAAITSAWGVILLVSGWLWTVYHYAIDMLTSVLSAIDQIVFPTVSGVSAGSLSYVFAVANTVTPLAELFAFIVAYVGLMVALTAYRAIKSWIPTLS